MVGVSGDGNRLPGTPHSVVMGRWSALNVSMDSFAKMRPADGTRFRSVLRTDVWLSRSRGDGYWHTGARGE